MNLILNKKWINSIILAIAILIIVIRHIDLFIYPRFWAEEGRVYFLDAFSNGYLSLWHGHQGYYSIIPNFATYFATLVPLEYAPVITTSIAFIVQILPLYLIYISKSEFIDSSLKKLLFSITVLFIGATSEIWLNTITSQFHCVIILFLILIENKENISTNKKSFIYFLVILSGLSGVPANILAPVFFYEYFRNKNRINLNIFILLCITSLVQVLYILSFGRLGGIHGGNHALIGNIFISIFQYPFLMTLKVGWHTFIIIPLFYIVIKYLSPKKYFNIFFSTVFLVDVIMIVTSVFMAGGKRYIYAASVIFIFGLIVALFDSSLNKFIKIILTIYVSMAFIVGVKNFPFTEGFADDKDWKRWKEEAISYQNKSKDTLSIYPQWTGKRKHWKVKLPRE